MMIKLIASSDGSASGNEKKHRVYNLPDLPGLNTFGPTPADGS